MPALYWRARLLPSRWTGDRSLVAPRPPRDGSPGGSPSKENSMPGIPVHRRVFEVVRVGGELGEDLIHLGGRQVLV